MPRTEKREREEESSGLSTIYKLKLSTKSASFSLFLSFSLSLSLSIHPRSVYCECVCTRVCVRDARGTKNGPSRSDAEISGQIALRKLTGVVGVSHRPPPPPFYFPEISSAYLFVALELRSKRTKHDSIGQTTTPVAIFLNHFCLVRYVFYAISFSFDNFILKFSKKRSRKNLSHKISYIIAWISF